MANIQHSTVAPVAPPPIAKPPRVRRQRAGVSKTRETPKAPAVQIDLAAGQLDIAFDALQRMDEMFADAKTARKLLYTALDDIGTGEVEDGLNAAYFITRSLWERLCALDVLWEMANRAVFILHRADKPTADPVVDLYERVMAAERAFDGTAEKSDPVLHEKRGREADDAAVDFLEARPVTAAGIAAKLKYLAHTENHWKEPEGFMEVRIIRDLVRQLTGDDTWTCPKPAGVAAREV